MNRKNFIRNSLYGLAAYTFGKNRDQVKASSHRPKHDLIGFNHLPLKESKKMNFVIHKASSRGHANHGWLDSHHSFSFASYYNPDRMNFGALRVLNDDVVDAGKGFDTHSHDNMEIISIPLEGDLEHRDSMGNVTIIQEGDIQVMSAGTGIRHSEYNKNQDKEVKFLQIWVYPHTQNLRPRYDQIKIDNTPDQFNQVLSPNADDQGVWIYQDAWFSIGSFYHAHEQQYQMKDIGNGLYVFIIEGKANIHGQELEKRDAMGIWAVDKVIIQPEKGSRILLMEVPMTF
jgi:redox-sensitive bicupin YhaK (pirin superfamily)